MNDADAIDNRHEEEQSGDGAAEDRTAGGGFARVLRTEGITIDGSLYALPGDPGAGPGDALEYDPGLVKGMEPVRDGGEVVGAAVANGEEALVGDAGDAIEVVREKFEAGFGIRGPATVREPPEDGGGGGRTDPDPLDDEEAEATILDNFVEHEGFFTEVDGEEKVVSLIHPDARPMGYITGSHVKSLPAGVETVDDYRSAVYRALAGEGIVGRPDSPAPWVAEADDVPIATDDMMETFRDAGDSMTDEQRERTSKRVAQRWEDGEYDHLRKGERDREADGG